MAASGARASRPHKGWNSRGYLPHFDSAAIVQSVVFRLADSLPAGVCAQIFAATEDDVSRQRLIDAAIDSCRGECLLRRPEVALIVRDAVMHFDGERYRVIAWVVMPNHAHVLIEQTEGFPLADVIHSWKSFTAKQINKRLGREGTLWAPDYFDRFVRDEAHYARAIEYIENNPVQAGLVDKPEDWFFSSAYDASSTGSAGVRPAFVERR